VLRTGNLDSLTGRTIARVTRRAKLLLVILDNYSSLVFHLKMTGRAWLAGQDQPLPKHAHLVCVLASGDRIIFEDQRRFGFCGLYTPEELATWRFYASLGPEPLESTPKELSQRLAGRQARIKSLLLNQTVLAGIGNIYADESLFAARIHPASRAACIPKARVTGLCADLQRILHAAIAAGGSTISDYRNSYGKSGLFQDHFAVYGKRGEPCPSCGQPFVTVRVAGRTSTHCPRCQRLYV
jgi:formamidopyrimidine-DNA glycosylase